MIRISQIKVKADAPFHQGVLRKKAARILKIPEGEIGELVIVRQSIDARKKPEIFYSYVIDVSLAPKKGTDPQTVPTLSNQERAERIREEKWIRKLKNNQVSLAEPAVYQFPAHGTAPLVRPPVIVGAGPAGLFCAYFLAKEGYRPILLERGADVDSRQEDVERFWQEGVLNPESNVQFGEGGAGTFSDGKLNTLVKDPCGRNRAVLETFVRFGARESILYEAKPHLGTDLLCDLVRRMREEIIRLGGEVRFHSRVSAIRMEAGQVKGVFLGTEELPCDQIVLAIGHSARDTLEFLYDSRIPMEPKAFAVGLRLEHPQSLINQSQYGLEHPGSLGAAPYKVTARTSLGRGVYSFCMCPGGYVVNASSEPGRLAVNGMSYSGRAGQNANSAIVVTVTPEDYPSEHPLAGIAFQRELEERAYRLGKGKIPVQRYGEFRNRVKGIGEGPVAETEPEYGTEPELVPQTRGAFVYADVSRILPEVCNRALVEGMENFGRMIPGFDRPDALLSGVESRTSSPVRILRDETLQSPGARGLYPCGEGAGYAGGITSAAMDGIRVAESIAGQYRSFCEQE